MGCRVENEGERAPVRLVFNRLLQCYVRRVHFLHIRFQEEDMVIPQETVRKLL